MRRRAVIQMILIGVLAGIATGAVAYFIPWLPDAASKEAGEIDQAYWFVAIICALIFALVAGVSIYAGWKFRAPPDDEDDGSPIHGHTGLEIWWTAIPTVLVVAMATFSGIALANIEKLPEEHGTIRVTSQQFAWSFTYPDAGDRTSGELVLEVDKPVRLVITSKDVIHSFWVPEFRMKQDAVPGIETTLAITPTKVGTYDVICTELCGVGHAVMRSRARVLSHEDYAQWLREGEEGGATGGQTETGGGETSTGETPTGETETGGETETEETETGAAGGGGGDEEAGKAVFESAGCSGCHTLAEAGSTGETGPDLDRVLAGKDEEFVHESIVDPNAEIAQGFQPNVMPQDYEERLSEDELDSLVAFLVGSVKG